MGLNTMGKKTESSLENEGVSWYNAYEKEAIKKYTF
jgi:hypothetical protein